MDLPPAWSLSSARSAGITRAMLRGPGFVRLAHDLVVQLDDAIDDRERLALLSRLLPPDAAYSHATAAVLLGAPIDRPERPHVVLTPRRVLPQHAAFVVHARRLAAADVVAEHGLRLTSGAQTYLDLAPHLWTPDLVAVGDALMRGGHLTVDSLAERLDRAGRVRGVVKARACAPLLSPHAMSRPESWIRYWLAVSDLPTPEAQLPICDAWGREVAHVDLGYEKWRIALEYEGLQHADRDQFGRDIDRYSLMAADGWLVLRFAARHVRGPQVVVERTRRTLLTRGWRPDAS